MPDESLTGHIEDPGEKTRMCPTCRMQISVLAVRCRFCGSSVGRPKEAARELTASDLGGETIYHRAPSGSVLDAMEAFRAEEESTLKPSDSESSQSGRVDDMPNLNSNIQDVLSMSLDESNMRSVAPPKPKSLGSRLVTLGGLILLLVAVIYGGIRGVDYFQARQAAANEKEVPDIVNRAPSIINRGGSPVEALEEAVYAQETAPTPENQRIVEDAFAYLKDRVDAHLNAEDWSRDELRQASRLANQAVEIYPNASTIGLKSDVDQENNAYKLVLVTVEGKEAEFRLNNPARDTVTVKRGDTLLDRFYVQSIVGQTVKLIDETRSERLITFDRPGALPR